jgi:hypothetical protein
MKKCGGKKSKHGCGENLSHDMFYSASWTKDGLHPYCKECTSKKNSAYAKSNPKKTRGYNVKKLYGISLAEYEALHEKQSSCCAVCGVSANDSAKGRLHVDHCHSTGAVRGLLCSNCNTSLGLLKDDPERIKKLLTYLEANIDSKQMEAA